MSEKKAPRGKPFAKGEDPRRAANGLPERYWAMREKAQGYGEECIEAAAALLREEAWQARVAGITILLERGYGKPSSAPEDLDAIKDAGPKASREVVLAALAGLTKEDA